MFNYLHVGRGIAALLVVFHHATLNSSYFYGTAFNDFFIFGNIGVDFFFVLSGFIISYAHRNDRIQNIGLYAKKRFIRIYPPFILMSLVMLALYSFLPQVSEGNRTEISLISSLLLIPDEHGSPALAVSWTLMHEAFFYCVFVISLYSRKIFFLFCTFWVSLIILHFSQPIKMPYANFLFNLHNVEFLFGVLAFYIYGYINRCIGVVCLLFGVGLLIIFPIYSTEMVEILAIPKTLVVGSICFMTVVGMVSFEDRKQFQKKAESKLKRIMMYLGVVSYSIYLVHSLVLAILNRIAAKIVVLSQINVELIFIILVILATFAGILYHILWEKPITKWLNRKYLNKPI